MEESCSGNKRRKGDHRQRPEQMSGMAAVAAAGISGIFDPDVLDCTICFYPLWPPVFQLETWDRRNLGFIPVPGKAYKSSLVGPSKRSTRPEEESPDA